MSPALLINGNDTASGNLSRSEQQLELWKTVSRFLPIHDEDQSFWWEVTGQHVARMMHEAKYPVGRQVELLLFYRFSIVPRLGPKPNSAQPGFKSRVAAGAGDGSPIGYSWRWGTGIVKPYIRHYIEPIGPLTGTAADPLNEFAVKEMLYHLGKTFETADLSSVWKFAAHLRPELKDESTRQKFSSSSMLVGLEWAPESDTVDVMAYFINKVPAQVNELVNNISPSAMRDVYGIDVSLKCLDAVRDFIATDPHGRQLTVLGTTAVDCCRLEASRFKIYAMTRNTSFEHIVQIMTLGGLRPATKEVIHQLRELWYGLMDLEDHFPTSAELSPSPMENGNGNGNGRQTAPHGMTFYFDIHPKYTIPHVKAQVDVSKYARSDMAAAKALTGFLERRGRGEDAQAYMNVLLGMVPAEELEHQRGLQAFLAFAIKNGEIDITSYFLPQVYRRFGAVKAELSKSEPVRQRRSRFE